jgi:hypothetical protein
VQGVLRQIAERFAEAGHEIAVATSYLPERNSWTVGGVTIRDFKVSGNLVYGIRGDIDSDLRLFALARAIDSYAQLYQECGRSPVRSPTVA